MSIRVESANGIMTITLDRPEKRNAMTGEMYRDLTAAFQALEADDTLRVGIVTGAGDRSFCAGADLVALHGGGGEDTTEPDGRAADTFDHARRAAQVRSGSAPWHAFRPTSFDHGLECSKPLIAAVNGYALAGGLELALFCDIRIASTTAQFGAPEVRWGILHGYGALRLASMVPASVANEMLLTGTFIDAGRALSVGLVSAVVSPELLMSTAGEMAKTIASNGPIAVRVTKELIARGAEVDLVQGLRLYQELSRVVYQSQDGQEGPRAFSEGRTPVFRGC